MGKAIPATVKRPVPGQKRWTIPDNWEQHVYSRRDSIAYALYYVPESDVWARVSIPTNDWLTDAWYGVQAISDLDVESVGELGSSYDVRQFADEYEEKYDVEGVEKEAEAFRVIADNWAFVEEDLSLATEWLQDDGLCEMWAGDRCARADNNWRIEVSQDPIFLPDKALKEVTSLSEYDIPWSFILEKLQNAELLPSYYTFELMLDDTGIDMEYHVRGLIEAGVSPVKAVEYYMIEVKGLTKTEWVKQRGVDQSTVSGNVRQAKEALK